MAALKRIPSTPVGECDSCSSWVIELHSADTRSGEGSFCCDCLGVEPETDFRTIRGATEFAEHEAERNEIPYVVLRDWDVIHRDSFYVMPDPEPMLLPGRYEEVRCVEPKAEAA